jgi:NAD(P)-dependent dehydrogenase (short-subunit alcohol dehydrogenase family)
MTYHSTPGLPIYGYHVPADNISKAAVNAFTVRLAYDLEDTNIKVNAAHPGWVKTDLGGEGETARRLASRSQ